MKKLLLILVSALLLFGCIGGPSAPSNITQTINQTITTVTQGCTPSLSVIPPNKAVLSSSTTLTVNASCAANKTVSVTLNGAEVASTTVPPGDSAMLNFNLVATPDGTNSLAVNLDGSQVYTGNWEVSSIGYTNAAGTDNDQIAIGRWKAVAFEAINPITVKKVSAYLIRLNSIMYGSNVIVEIRSDSGGKPGSVVATTSLPINKTTLTPNWVHFPISAQLQKGRYWVVFREDGLDEVNIRFVTVDKLAPGNPNILMMDLIKNEDTRVWSETEWKALAYDRNYAFVVSASD